MIIIWLPATPMHVVQFVEVKDGLREYTEQKFQTEISNRTKISETEPICI